MARGKIWRRQNNVRIKIISEANDGNDNDDCEEDDEIESETAKICGKLTKIQFLLI